MSSWPMLRNRTAVLTVTGVAALASCFYIYTAFVHQPAALRRSNALHRDRRGRLRSTRPVIEATLPDSDHPLGTMIISKGSNSVTFAVAIEPFPTGQELIRLFGALPQDFERDIIDAAVQQVLLIVRASREPSHIARLDALGLELLRNAMSLSSDDEIRTARHVISTALGGANMEAVGAGVEHFIQGARNTTDLPGVISPATGVEPAETEYIPDDLTNPHQRGHGLRGLLYYIAEEDAKRKAYEHRGITCEECSEGPIRGVRYHCLNCADFDLCATCESQTLHEKTHVLAKIKIPLPVLSQPLSPQPLWYPGDPSKFLGTLEPAVRKQFAEAHGYEEPSVDALFDQFSCIANVDYPNDACKIYMAIDFHSFWKALTPDRWQNRYKPTSLMDRMFSFYDTNSDAKIGFAEFISGMAYLRGPKRYEDLSRALQGYDTDRDGYVDRKDFLRLLRAKYDVNRQLVRDMVSGRQEEHTESIMQTIRSSQPISSVFNHEEIPRGDEGRPTHGKYLDSQGDLQLEMDFQAILSDDEPWTMNGVTQSSRERVTEHLVRLEHIFNGGLEPLRLENEASTPTFPDEGAETERRSDAAQMQDVVWSVTEDGMNALLDRIFQPTESKHHEVVSSRQERKRWAKEIENVRQKHDAGADSGNEHGIESELVPKLVPTDPESLEQQERTIMNATLEELLEAAGYTATELMREINPAWDPTMPQFRPDRVPRVETRQKQDSTPSKARLQALALLELGEEEIRVRGAPGRLSLQEVDHIIQADSTGEVRGLVLSWLDFASF